jgi:tRNA-2-methylthio-N6-dimethylallyladenosine synthase
VGSPAGVPAAAASVPSAAPRPVHGMRPGACAGGPLEPPLTSPRRFFLRTYGCQMNVHDSEKVANLLHHAGYRESAGEDDADVLIVNTCSIRDKAEHQLYSDLGVLRDWRAAAPGRVLGVAGCVAQQEGDRIQRRFPHVDFVFGTHNVRLVPSLLASAEAGSRSLAVEETSSLDRFDLPARHPDFEGGSPGRAFLTVMEGCDMFCSFCIVPTTRGREISRPAGGIIDEARALAERGVCELTLLGQTVNAYGRHDLRRDRAREAGTLGFAELLERLARIPGISRLRYTSPHPLFFDEALVRAHGDNPALCPHVHLPLQSGSDAVLERMNRRCTREHYLGLVETGRRLVCGVEFASDFIVGFPGETDEDFEQTLGLLRQVRFQQSFIFRYSPRPGTRAARWEDDVPDEVKRARQQALLVAQEEVDTERRASLVGAALEVMCEGANPNHAHEGRFMGRTRQNDIVVFDGEDAAPGTVCSVRIENATALTLFGRRLSP